MFLLLFFTHESVERFYVPIFEYKSKNVQNPKFSFKEPEKNKILYRNYDKRTTKNTTPTLFSLTISGFGLNEI